MEPSSDSQFDDDEHLTEIGSFYQHYSVRSAHHFSFDLQLEDLVFSVMDGDRRFGIHYTHRGCTSSPRVEDSEIQGIVKQLDVLVNKMNQNHKQMTQLILNPRFEQSMISLF